MSGPASRGRARHFAHPVLAAIDATRAIAWEIIDGMPNTKTDTPVLIVGAGPVGLALAGDLGWRGVACTLIEKTEGKVDHPKMDLIGVRTMEFCRRWGIADRVRDAPYPPDYPQDYVWLESFTGYEFGREKFPGRAFEPL